MKTQVQILIDQKDALEYLIDMEEEGKEYDYSKFNFEEFLQNMSCYNEVSIDQSKTLFYNLEMDLTEILESEGEIDMHNEMYFNDSHADMMYDMGFGDDENDEDED